MKACLLEKFLYSLIIGLWLGWCAVAQAAGPPTITGIWPSAPVPGTMTFVFGANFSLVSGENKVSIGGVATPVVQMIDSSLLVFFTPFDANGGQVCVSTPAGNTCLDQSVPMCSGSLCITGVWSGAYSGAFVFGSGFTSPLTITFSGYAAPIYQLLSSDMIFILLPPGTLNPDRIKICNRAGNCVCWPTACVGLPVN